MHYLVLELNQVHAYERTHIDSLKATAAVIVCLHYVTNDRNGGLIMYAEEILSALPQKKIIGHLPNKY